MKPANVAIRAFLILGVTKELSRVFDNIEHLSRGVMLTPSLLVFFGLPPFRQ
jgi:hypothetical protein